LVLIFSQLPQISGQSTVLVFKLATTTSFQRLVCFLKPTLFAAMNQGVILIVVLESIYSLYIYKYF